MGRFSTTGVELTNEESAALGLVRFAEHLGGLGQSGQAGEETAVRGVLPPHVTTAPPTVGAESVEPSVITDPEVGVALDRIDRRGAERRPHVRRTRVETNHFTEDPATFPFGTRRRVPQGRFEVRRRRGQDRLGRSGRRQTNGIRIGHAISLLVPKRRCDITWGDPRYASIVNQILALSADVLKNVTTFGALLPILVGLLIVKFAVNAVVRTIVLVVALALGVLIFTQRSTIQTCVDDFKREAGNVANAEAPSFSCSILGRDFRLEL